MKIPFLITLLVVGAAFGTFGFFTDRIKLPNFNYCGRMDSSSSRSSFNWGNYEGTETGKVYFVDTAEGDHFRRISFCVWKKCTVKVCQYEDLPKLQFSHE
jgi:hypothetical protein